MPTEKRGVSRRSFGGTLREPLATRRFISHNGTDFLSISFGTFPHLTGETNNVNLFAVIVGSIAGLVVGFFVGWLLPEFRWIKRDIVQQTLAGSVCGGIFGGIAGSISGDANRGSSSSHSFLVAFIFGAAFGAIGGSQFQLVGKVLDLGRIPHPFH